MQMQFGTGCVPVGWTCVQDCATHSAIRQMRYLTGCGISPLHHRFTPKMESKGVSEMLWKCRSRTRCHHATPYQLGKEKPSERKIKNFNSREAWNYGLNSTTHCHQNVYIESLITNSPLPTHGCNLVSFFAIWSTKKLCAVFPFESMSSSKCNFLGDFKRIPYFLH